MNQWEINKQIEDYNEGNSDYLTAVALFSKLSQNRALLNTFFRGDSEHNVDLLRYELSKFYDDELEQQEEEPPREEIIAPVSIRKTSEEIITGFTDQQKKLYRERGYLHGALHAAKSDEERLSIMTDLAKCQSQIDKYYLLSEKVKNGNYTGDLIPENASLSVYKQIQNLKDSIRKAKKAIIEQPDSPLNKTRRESIAAKQKQIEKLISE